MPRLRQRRVRARDPVVTWAYNGSDTLSVTIDDAVVGHNYGLFAFDGTSSEVDVTATSSALTITVPDIGGLSAGDTFLVDLTDNTSPFTDVACTIFEYGTADDEYPYDASWAYDGDKTISVTFTAASGVTYTLFTPASESSSGGPYTAGSTQTLTVVKSINPAAAGQKFFCYLQDDQGTFGNQLSDRLFQQGSAGSGVPGNPTGVAPTVPTNTSCGAARPMLPSVSGSFSFDNTEAPDPDHVTDPFNIVYGSELDGALWYVYTAPVQGYLEVTIDPTSHTSFGLFEGTCGALTMPTADTLGPRGFFAADESGGAVTIGMLVRAHERVYVEAGTAGGEAKTGGLTISWQLLAATVYDTLENSSNLEDGESHPFGPRLPHYDAYSDGITLVLAETIPAIQDYAYFEAAHWLLTSGGATAYPGSLDATLIPAEGVPMKVWRVTDSAVTRYDLPLTLGFPVITNVITGDGYWEDPGGSGRIVTDGTALWVVVVGVSTAELEEDNPQQIYAQQVLHYDHATDSFLEPGGVSSLLLSEAWLGVTSGGVLGPEAVVVDGELIVARAESGRFDPGGTGFQKYRSHILFNRWNKDSGWVALAQPAYFPVADHLFDGVSVFLYERYGDDDSDFADNLLVQMGLSADSGAPFLFLAEPDPTLSPPYDLAPPILDVIDLSDPSVLVYNAPPITQTYDARDDLPLLIESTATTAFQFHVTNSNPGAITYIRVPYGVTGSAGRQVGYLEMPSDASSPPAALDGELLNLHRGFDFTSEFFIVDGDTLWIPADLSTATDEGNGDFFQWDTKCGPAWRQVQPLDDVYLDAGNPHAASTAAHGWRSGTVIYWAGLREGEPGSVANDAYYGVFATKILHDRLVCEVGEEVVLAGGLHVWDRV